ncbi:hypothetical protein XENORESO_018017 [Xenotaenia resolanae]|uniref:Uncharacterized protein n=1 Tax=Xenotaenia resolanae TaxID=208358 RepID=A0ABV0WS53_9TELE
MADNQMTLVQSTITEAEVRFRRFIEKQEKIAGLSRGLVLNGRFSEGERQVGVADRRCTIMNEESSSYFQVEMVSPGGEVGHDIEVMTLCKLSNCIKNKSRIILILFYY